MRRALEDFGRFDGLERDAAGLAGFEGPGMDRRGADIAFGDRVDMAPGDRSRFVYFFYVDRRSVAAIGALGQTDLNIAVGRAIADVDGFRLPATGAGWLLATLTGRWLVAYAGFWLTGRAGVGLTTRAGWLLTTGGLWLATCAGFWLTGRAGWLLATLAAGRLRTARAGRNRGTPA